MCIVTSTSNCKEYFQQCNPFSSHTDPELSSEQSSSVYTNRPQLHRSIGQMILLLSSCIGQGTVEDSSGLVVMAVENGLVLKPDSNPKCRSGVLTNSTVPTPRQEIEREAGREEKKLVLMKRRNNSHLITFNK